LGDDAFIAFKDDKSLPVVSGDDLFFLFGRWGQSFPGQVVFVREGEGEVAIHKGVNVEVFCGGDIGLPDWRVVVEIQVPEGLAGEARGNHI